MKMVEMDMSTINIGNSAMYFLVLLTSALLLLGNVHAECPHKRSGLLRWSDSATWGSNGKPAEGENVNISQNILIDESPPSLKNITIQANYSLIFDPEVEIEVRAMNIFVYGNMEIGSEDCPYNKSLTITMTGNRGEHNHASNPKVILVKNGGTLEIHGEPRLSWTVLNETLQATKNTDDVYFEHQTKPTYNSNIYPRIITYTVSVDGTVVNVKRFGVYNLRTDGQELVYHINNVTDGDVLMMASQRKVLQKANPDLTAYDALETLVTGGVTNSGIFRSVNSEGETWAFVYKKGTPSSHDEEKNPLGTTSTAQYKESDDLIYTVESIGDLNVNKQSVNFRITNLNALNPLVSFLDDVTTWHPGDEIVISSTDFSSSQAEKRKIVFCPTCNNFQRRIDKPVQYMHYGKVLHDAVDMRAEVMLLTRRVVIRGEMESTCHPSNENCGKSEVLGQDTFGAHVKVLYGYKAVHIENVEIYNAGQQTDLGRYPFHFHMCFGANQNQPYIKGCSIHDTFARCVTIHGSNDVLVSDNACFNHMGHGYYLEDGAEFDNVFDGNLAINARKGTGKLEPSDADRPSGFWITNPRNTVINNHAAGGEGTGIWVIFPKEPLPPSRQFNLMEEFEVRRTPLKDFTNNVAHSNDFFGIHIGARIEDNRDTHCCNIWQPLADPKNASSAPIDVIFQNITGFKNEKFNIWIEGSLLQVSRISVADSTNGIMVSNEKLLDHAGTLSYSVIIGDSDNVGEPSSGSTRSLVQTNSPHSGIAMWRGVNNYHHIWFDGFKPNNLYDNAAIMKKRGERYFFSVTNAFRDVLFAHDDADGVGNYFMTGNKTNPGWENNRDGELMMGLTWYKNSTDKWFIVKPDPFSAAAPDCKLRPNWRLAMSKTKYGNWRLHHSGIDAFYSHGSLGVFVRDKFPGAQLTFDLEKSAGPQVVLNGTETYTFHTTGQIPDWLKFTADGIETNEMLRVGICIPPGATWELSSKFPDNLNAMSKFIQVNSLTELDLFEPDKDGKKYFYNSTTGMVYYKFRGVHDRAPDDKHECGGEGCPEITVKFSGDLTGSGDCRQRLYGSDLTKLPSALPTYTDTITANGDSQPPPGYGHGSSRPFSSRKPVNGRFSDWSAWSECSQTCGGGTQHKTRECNSPIPSHGGRVCINPWIKTRSCSTGSCD